MASRTKFAQRLAELQHEDVAVRRVAARKLGDYGDTAALTELCAALRDPSWKVQRNAAVALGKLSDPAAVEALSSVFIDSSNRKRYLSVSTAALHAMGRIGTEAAAEAIATIWLSDHDDLRQIAQGALLNCGVNAVPVVCKQLFGKTSGEKTDESSDDRPEKSALLAQKSQFWFTAAVYLHLVPDHQAQLRHEALNILHSFIDKRGIVVFECILATAKLAPGEKFECLEILHRRLKFLSVVIYFRDTIFFCEQAAVNANDPEVKKGAEEVLAYCSLARGSHEPLDAQDKELLRAARADDNEVPGTELLRASDGEPTPENEELHEPEGIIAKALRQFRRHRT